MEGIGVGKGLTRAGGGGCLINVSIGGFGSKVGLIDVFGSKGLNDGIGSGR